MQMSVLNSPSNNNRNRVIKELLQGKEYATQLKFLLFNQNPSADHPSAKELLTNVLRSFADTLSVITSSDSVAVGSGGDTENLVNSGADSNNDLRSEDSTGSKKRLSPTAKDRRGSYKRRKTEETRSKVSETIEDNHAWRKYGQKEILNSPFPRSYFRCTRKHDQGCRATKQVQRIQENPDMYQITYIGYHTCNATLEAPNMLTFSDTCCWDSFLVNSKKPESKVPIEVQNPPPITPQCPTVKQEYPNEASSTPSDVTDNLDPNMWSDLKDFELSKPAKLPSSNVNTAYMCSEYQNLEKGYYGVFSSDLDFPF